MAGGDQTTNDTTTNSTKDSKRRRPKLRERSPRLQRGVDLAVYLAVRTLAAGFGMLSVRQTRRLAAAMSSLMMRLPPKIVRRAVAEQNLCAAFPDWSDRDRAVCIRRMYAHLIRMAVEYVQFPRHITLETCREVMVFRNRKASVRAACSGRPVLMLGGHFGNWEASLAAFGVFGFPMGVVARKLDNPFLEAWMDRERSRFGHKLYWKRGGYDGLLELLQAGGNLALLCDQDAGRRGVFCDFFGRPASTVKSLALLAIEHDALLVVGYGRRLPDDARCRWTRYEIGCEAVLDPRDHADDPAAVTRLTEGYTAALERAIRRSPEQYFWVHRRWKSEPRRRKAAVPRRRAA